MPHAHCYLRVAPLLTCIVSRKAAPLMLQEALGAAEPEGPEAAAPVQLSGVPAGSAVTIDST